MRDTHLRRWQRATMDTADAESDADADSVSGANDGTGNGAEDERDEGNQP
ncbi:MAG: hypothetical protein ABI382_10260 [Nakamurella sp.]